MVGLARGALAAGLKYAKEREQFGQPIARFQAIQMQLAQARTEVEAARLMVYNAARMKDAGEDFIIPAAMAKLSPSCLYWSLTNQSPESLIPQQLV